MAICRWEVASGSGDSKFGIWKGASGSGDSKFGIGKGVSGSGSNKIDIGMRAAQQAIGSRKLAVGSWHRAVVSS